MEGLRDIGTHITHGDARVIVNFELPSGAWLHLELLPKEARAIARLLIKHALECETDPPPPRGDPS